MDLKKAVVELYTKCATDLPKDAEEALFLCLKNEDRDSLAFEILTKILENVRLAREDKVPICQDTGTPVFYVCYPRDYTQKRLRDVIIEATKIATAKIPLRPNAVDAITGKNSGSNVGVNFPVIYFEESNQLRIDLMLKGGGSENIGIQYKLPDKSLGAGRDLAGIKKCVLDAMVKAQGKGCSPNMIGVAIGGSKDVAAALSKKQLLRKIGDVNNNPELNKVEKELKEDINKLGIGPLGLGGKATCLAVKMAKSHRHPASFFVDINFLCWAARRYALIFKENKFKIE